MAAITIGGVALDCQDGTEGEPFYVGASSRAFSGNLRNSVRAQKRIFSGTSIPYEEATFESFLAVIANQAQVTCSGLILRGDSITATVRCTDAKLVPGSSLWVFSFAGEQV